MNDRGRGNRKKKQRTWQQRFGRTSMGRGLNYLHFPKGLQGRFQDRGIRNVGQSNAQSNAASQSNAQSNAASQSNAQSSDPSESNAPSQYNAPSDPNTPQSVQDTPQSQQLAQSIISSINNNGDLDIDMPPSRGATPLPPHSTPAASTPAASTPPGTDEVKRADIPSTPELVDRALRQTIPLGVARKNTNDPKIKSRQRFIHVVEATRKYLPQYYQLPLTTDTNRSIFSKYFKQICIKEGCLKLGDSIYCLRDWRNNSLSNKHFWHCSKSRGSKDYTCDCDQWQATDDMKCFHTLISTLADDPARFEQPDIAVHVQEYQKMKGDNVVYLGTYEPSMFVQGWVQGY